MMQKFKIGAGFFLLPMRQDADSTGGVRGRQFNAYLNFLSRQSLPTDPVGTYTLTLVNLVIGSRIRIEALTTGAAVHEALVATTTLVVPLQVYAPGSPANDLKIKVGKASQAPFYRRYETQLSITPNSSSSIFVNQERDDE
jgi:hypothetical protein